MRSGITLRAFVIGVVLCFFIGVADSYVTLVLEESGRSIEVSRSMTFEVSAPMATFLLLVLMAINWGISNAKRSLALNFQELTVIFVMMLVSCALPSRTLAKFLPAISAPFYYATPENEWADIIQPYVKAWMVPQDPDAIKFLYEGAPKGVGFLIKPWIGPLLSWLPLFISLYVVSISVMTILRKQWMDHERLVYPLTQLPLEMVQNAPGGNPGGSFFRSKLTWVGFVIPCVFLSINYIGDYYPFLPSVKLETLTYVFRRTEELRFFIIFSVIGFTYFVNLDIAFSLWFFNILFKIIRGTFRIVGISVIEPLGPFSPGRSPIFIHQGMGAMIALVIFGFWTGRRHLRSVMRKALRGDRDVDDSNEILSYRTAVILMVLGLSVMIIWLCASGIPIWAVFVLLFAAFVLLIGLSRIVSESGISQIAGPMTAQAFLSSGIGSAALGPQAMTSIGFCFMWIGAIKTPVTALTASGLRMADLVGKPKRLLFWAIIIGLMACFFGCIIANIWCGYTYGGLNLARYPFKVGAKLAFLEYAEPFIRNPSTPRWDGWFYTAIGAVAMYLLMFMHYRFLWWPLHPVGFPICTIWPTHFVWFSIFIAWLLKAAVLKYGGPKLFKSARPFFLGLILGEFTTRGVWLIVNAIFLQ